MIPVWYSILDTRRTFNAHVWEKENHIMIRMGFDVFDRCCIHICPCFHQHGAISFSRWACLPPRDMCAQNIGKPDEEVRSALISFTNYQRWRAKLKAVMILLYVRKSLVLWAHISVRIWDAVLLRSLASRPSKLPGLGLLALNVEKIYLAKFSVVHMFQNLGNRLVLIVSCPRARLWSACESVSGFRKFAVMCALLINGGLSKLRHKQDHVFVCHTSFTFRAFSDHFL